MYAFYVLCIFSLGIAFLGYPIFKLYFFANYERTVQDVMKERWGCAGLFLFSLVLFLFAITLFEPH